MLDGDTFVFIAVGWVGVSFFFLQRLSKEGRIVRRGQEKKVLQQQSLETEIVQTNSRILVPMVVNLCALLHVFFFQAEDGIRDCLLSRGLGDVYKRQTRS